MKRVIGIFILLFSLVYVSAISCNPEVSLINQDPYPAIPGEYVKLVFQINELSNPECESFKFELLEKYPLIFDTDFNPVVNINTGFYERDFNSFLIAPYKVRIDSEALDGNNPIETQYSYGSSDSYFLDEFNVSVEDARADFEIHIDQYSYATNEMTLEILNIADTDVEALTIEIEKQDNIEITGTNRVIAGDLDSNEYTTVDFNAIPKEGEIKIKIIYTDQIGTRRELVKTIYFDSSYFLDTKTSDKWGWETYLIILVVIALFVWWFNNRKKRKAIKMRRHGSSKFSL